MRMFSVPVNITAAFTAQIDIFELLPASGKPCTLFGWELGQLTEVGDTQEEVLALVLKYVTGAPTSGTGGPTAPTPRPMDPNDATAAGFTVEIGNTTKMTGGTSVELKRFPWSIRTPHLYVPIPEVRHIVAPDEHLVLELVTTPADSITGIVGWIDVGEGT